MNRVFIIVLVFLLTACSATEKTTLTEVNFKPGVIVNEDLSLYDKNENITISIGMNREEIENKLGPLIDTIGFLGLYEYEGIKVHYNKDNIVNGFMIDDNTENNDKFSTLRGIKYGDSLDTIINKYGEPSAREDSKNNTAIHYLFEEANDGFVVISSYEEAQDKDKTYIISINIDPLYGVYTIMIADYYFAMFPTQL